MMLPSAAPMILLHAMVDRKSKTSQGSTPWRTAAFTAGYLAVWAFFSATAAGLQWTFEGAGLLSPMMMNSTSALFAAAILLFAGLYQLTPIKQACLKHCRGPVQFLSRHWRPGAGGAFSMGAHHGAYCLGCCWGLMAILFFGGIMNLYWIIGLAVIVLLEKLMPVGPRLNVVTGGLFLAWGAYFFYSGLV
jgi:predicted metal-binding membrane protein